MVLAIFAGCSGGRTVPVPVWMAAVAEPIRPESVIDVTPAELGAPAVVSRMRHRVRLKALGRAWLRLGVTPISEPSSGEDEGADELLPVIGETANRIRVVTEEDGARVAVWVERRDAWEAIVAPVVLDARGGPAGVWLEAGAQIGVARVRAKGIRIVELRDEALEVRGAVPPAFVGHVWTVAHDDRSPTTMARTCPEPSPPADEAAAADPRRRELAAGTEIRAAASEEAPLLATVSEALDVVLLGEAAGWAELELRRPYVRIRGHVPADTLEEAGELGGFVGSCGGSGGFGISHADRIDVPAGTCLFDRANGDVVGVATEAKTRLGSLGRHGDEWSMVHVDTRWSVTSMWVRDVGAEPARRRGPGGAPVLESCTRDLHRR